MATIWWPNSILRPRDMVPFLRPLSRSGGVSLNGVEQVIASPALRWEFTISVGREFNGETLRQFEALVARMRGRRNVAVISLCDPYRYGDQVSPAQEPWSDGTWFTDGTGWAAPGTQPMTTAAAAPVGAETLRTVLTNPRRPQLRVGDFFSVDQRLYRVETVDGTDITFGPPLRVALPAGTVLDTDPARGMFRFATDGEGQRQREFMRWGGEVSLTFHEAF